MWRKPRNLSRETTRLITLKLREATLLPPFLSPYIIIPTSEKVCVVTYTVSGRRNQIRRRHHMKRNKLPPLPPPFPVVCLPHLRLVCACVSTCVCVPLPAAVLRGGRRGEGEGFVFHLPISLNYRMHVLSLREASASKTPQTDLPKSYTCRSITYLP